MSWMVLTRVNHSMNPDGGAVRFQVIATDLVGRSLVELEHDAWLHHTC